MSEVSEKELAERKQEIQEVFDAFGLGSEAEREEMRSKGQPQSPESQEDEQASSYKLELTNTADSSPHPAVT